MGSSSFTDLMYADDTTLFATSSQSAVESLSSFQNAASVLGMYISWPKTKVQNLGTGQPLSDVSVDAHHVECVAQTTSRILAVFSRQTAIADLTSDVGLRSQRQ